MRVACREVQRILMELLNQMDGFDQNVNVKVRKTLSSPLGLEHLRMPVLGWAVDYISGCTLTGRPDVFARYHLLRSELEQSL